MSGQTIDYDALAKKYGATSSTAPGVDYDALAKQYGATSSQPATQSGAMIKAAPEIGSKAWWKEKLYNAADTFVESLPAAGATIGSFIGGGAGTAGAPGPGTVAGAVGGAGIGGMAGDAAAQLMRRAIFGEGPQTSGEAAMSIAKQGALQGAIQGVTEGVGRLAPSALSAAAEKQYMKGLKPTTGENKAIAQDIVPEMLDRGIHGSTENIEAQAAGKIQQLRPQLNAAYANVPANATRAQNPVYSTLSALDAMKSKYVVDGKVVNPNAYNAIDATQQIVSQYRNDVSPQSLRKIKQIFDESVSEAGGYTNNDLTTNYQLKAQREAASRIRDILHTAAPDAAALDKEMSFWLDVQQVARATNLRTTGQEGGLLKTFTPLASAGAGAAGLPFGAEASIGAAATTALAGYVAQASRTTAWRTASAITKDRLADALARNDVIAVSSLLARLGVTIPAAVTASQLRNRSTQQ